jgi:hypothetical protein
MKTIHSLFPGCRYCLIVIFLLIGSISYSQQMKTVVLFVAPEGQKDNTGSKTSPLTLDGARDYLQKIKGPAAITVYLRAGLYYFTKPFVIASLNPDSTQRLVFAAYNNEKVIFTGSLPLDNKKFSLVKDRQILDRLPAESRGKVYVTNLSGQGLTDFGKMIQHGAHAVNPSLLEIYDNEKALTPARWPNSGMAPIGKVLDPGSNLSKGEKDNRGAKFILDNDRINAWKRADHIWLNGYFSLGYTDDNVAVDSVDIPNKTIMIKQPTGYGVFGTDDASTPELRNAMPIRGFYAYNLLEELDEPGEWYVDQASGNLYVWPPDNSINTATLSVGVLEDPLVVLSNTVNITFKGIRFSGSRGMGLLLQKTKNTSILHCVFNNFGTVAISTGNQFNNKAKTYLTGNYNQLVGYNNNLLIQNCLISNTGTGAITLDGGDRKNLLAANNRIDNCEIFNFSRINKTYSPAVAVDGDGNQVTHCYIHDAPDQAITFYGNDHLISFNHIKNVVTYATDMSAVYTGRDPSAAGTEISYNFFDNIGSAVKTSVASIYLDDGTGGMHINSNIFYKASTPGAYGFGAIYINGGANTSFANNYFIDCDKAFSSALWTDKQWRVFVTKPDITRRFLKDVNVYSEVYKRAYPGLTSLVDSTTMASRQNFSYNTLAYRVGTFSTGAAVTHQNVFNTNTDPGFADPAAGNFTLTGHPAALQQAKDWKPIPFSEIGPKKN